MSVFGDERHDVRTSHVILNSVGLPSLKAEHPVTNHHRGQLLMYLRPMGAKVPSIYG